MSELTLDDAIKHCLEVAEQKEHESFIDRWSDDDEWSESVKEKCRQCAADHRQLVEWLTELKSKQWISCKDKMPDDNELVLFCYVGESGIKSVHYGYHQTVRGLGSSWGKISGGWRYCNDDVTHWMPLPEPPKEDDAE